MLIWPQQYLILMFLHMVEECVLLCVSEATTIMIVSYVTCMERVVKCRAQVCPVLMFGSDNTKVGG